MAVEQIFKGELQQLRGRIDRVDAVSVQLLDHNGRGNVQQIRAFADRPERLAAEMAAVDRGISRFADVYARHSTLAFVGDERSKRAIDDERGQLHDRIDALEKALDGVNLNDLAKHIL